MICLIQNILPVTSTLPSVMNQLDIQTSLHSNLLEFHLTCCTALTPNSCVTLMRKEIKKNTIESSSFTIRIGETKFHRINWHSNAPPELSINLSLHLFNAHIKYIPSQPHRLVLSVKWMEKKNFSANSSRINCRHDKCRYVFFNMNNILDFFFANSKTLEYFHLI